MNARAINPPLWSLPMLYVGVTVLVGLVLPRIEYHSLAAYSHGMSVASAQAALSAIASGMLALTGIVFALAFVMVQFSATAYSPRLVTWLSDDPTLFHALGLFMATFGYAIAALAWTDRGGNGKVPLFSVAIVIVLLILSMLVFARLVHRLTHLQIAHVLAFIGRRGRSVIRTMFPRLDAPAAAAESWQSAMERLRDRPLTQPLRYSGEPRVVTRFALAALAQQAEAADAVIVLECAVGDTLVEDSLLLRVHGARALLPEDQLRETIQLARERTFEQDPRYALRLLVDIAIRALSPAINDPTTAVQAIDQIEDLLRRLGRRALDAGCLTDAGGTLRVVFPTPSWEDYLSLAFDEIRHYGADSLQVMRRLRAALLGLEDSVTDGSRQELIQRYLKQLDRTVKHSIEDAQEQLTALREDRQGLGLTRRPPASEATGVER